jgi:hypothetical protein
MEFPIYGIGRFFSSAIHHSECVQPGRDVHDHLRVPALTALPRGRVGLARAMMDREIWHK